VPTRLKSSDVFINCPFDADYRPIFNAIIFAVDDLGFVARCALEEDDAGDYRLSKIERMIEECRFAINDLSAVALNAVTHLPRFNMPLELGLFFGCKRYGPPNQAKKKTLVLDADHPSRQPPRRSSRQPGQPGNQGEDNEGACHLKLLYGPTLFQSLAHKPSASQTIRPSRTVSTQQSLRSPASFAWPQSTKPNAPFSIRSTAISAGALSLEWPRSARPIARAAFTVDQLFESEPHVEELRKSVHHVCTWDHDAALVHIGGDCVRQKILVNGGYSDAEPEVAVAVAHIEQHAAFASRPYVLRDFPGCVHLRNHPVVDVGLNVAWPHVFQEEIGVSAMLPRK
jgi:hypothetical protein